MNGKRKLSLGVAGGVLLAAVVIVIGIVSLSGDEEPATSQAPPAEEATAGTEEPDQQAVALFSDNCGQCHTLSVAETTGDIGPDLDGIEYDRERVLTAIERGGRGSGEMPANLIEGADAEAVAELIANDEPAG